MAIQTMQQLKDAFGAGCFPTAQNWSDLIDTVFSMNEAHGKVRQVVLEGYGHGGISPSDLNRQGMDYQNAWNGGTLDIEYPIDIDDILGGMGVPRPDNGQYNVLSDIVIIHNDGFYYGYCNNEDASKVYIKWRRNGGEGSTSYLYNQDDNIAVVPVGGQVAFCHTDGGGWQPIGQYTGIDAGAVRGSKTAFES